MHVKNGRVPEKITIGVAVVQQDRSILFSASTEMDKQPVDIEKEGFVTLLIPSLQLLAGDFIIMCGVMDEHGFHRFHQLPTEQNLLVKNTEVLELGVFLHSHEWRVETEEKAPRQAERPV